MPLTNCKNCGKPVFAGAERCPHCGAALKQEAERQTQVESTETSPQPKPKSKLPIVIIIIAAALLCCAAGGYFYYKSIYLPKKVDREAPRHYTIGNTALCSPRCMGADFNKLATLAYSTKYFKGERYGRKAKEVEQTSFIVVSKEDMRLRLFDCDGSLLKEFPIACGKGLGNKTKRGDMRTPEGVFRVSSIENSSTWSHDFGNGNGKIRGAYGPYFIRMEVPSCKGIGIHGTHDPSSIGSRVTEGCIRLENSDLLSLKEDVYVGMMVIITTSAADSLASQ